ncbi:hypothetical protein ScPMuIL_010305 [Solemya velum]
MFASFLLVLALIGVCIHTTDSQRGFGGKVVAGPHRYHGLIAGNKLRRELRQDSQRFGGKAVAGPYRVPGLIAGNKLRRELRRELRQEPPLNPK